MGITLLVMAEVLAMKAKWKESEEAINQSIQIFKSSKYGLYLEALAHVWYGETLVSMGQKAQGYEALLQARSIYSKLANESQVNKIDEALSECEYKSCNLRSNSDKSINSAEE